MIRFTTDNYFLFISMVVEQWPRTKRGGAVPALLLRGRPKRLDNYPEGFDDPVAPNHLDHSSLQLFAIKNLFLRIVQIKFRLFMVIFINVLFTFIT